jgi:hypothetical protein
LIRTLLRRIFFARKKHQERNHKIADDSLYLPAPPQRESDDVRLVRLRYEYMALEALVESTRQKMLSLDEMAKKHRDIYETMKLDSVIIDEPIDFSHVGMGVVRIETKVEELNRRLFDLSHDKWKLQQEIEQLAVKLQDERKYFSPRPEPIAS